MAPSSNTVPSIESQTSEPVDLASTPQSLAQAVYARRAEFVRPHRIKVKIGTWNVAGCPGTDKDLARWFVFGEGLDPSVDPFHMSHNEAIERRPSVIDGESVRCVGGEKVGLYVLGLQEIIDLNAPQQYMNRVYSDPLSLGKWKDALDAAMPSGYELVSTEAMSGLLILVYASPEVAESLSDVSSTQVGTGLMGYFGNKGAVATRILLGETTRIAFINCHLASGQEQTYLDRRIWDANTIATRAHFDPISIAGVRSDEPEKIGEQDFAFWFGDLNFRVDGLPGDDIRRLLGLHSRGEYDLSKTGTRGPIEGEGVIVVRNYESDDDTTEASDASSKQSFDDSTSSLPDPDEFLPDPADDPASLQATLDSLLPHDQLRRLMREQKVFHDGWREGAITFLPSYKYDVGTVSLFDSSEKQRAPSWCDRILYRSRKDKEDYEKKVHDTEEAKKKDEELEARGIDHAADDDDVLFSYDPDADGEDQPGTPGLDYDEYDEGDDNGLEVVTTREGFVDRMQLDLYTSHQRITSSDHKPVVAVFTLDYDAVVPELKAKIHAEVARELDRAENEGRPMITIIVEGKDSSEVDLEHGDAVDFGDVEYLRKQAASLTIANTGRTSATFSFVEKPAFEDNSSTPQNWLTTSFVRPDHHETDDGSVDIGKEVTLEPGETIIALLEVLIDNISHVRALNDGRAVLEDVLVLRVEDGRDHFLPVKGTWLPSCFGRSIEELIRVPDGGIRAFATSRLAAGAAPGAIPYDLDVRVSAPKELFKLTEAISVLIERVLADEQMLEGCHVPRENAGWPFDESSWKLDDREAREQMKLALIQALDLDKSLLECLPAEMSALYRVEAVAQVLLLFLDGLTDGIITAPLWAKLEAALPNIGAASRPTPGTFEDDKASVLDVLSVAPNHNIAFVFLTTTLAKVAAELAPLTKADLDARPAARKPLSFRRSVGAVAKAEAAIGRRRARERRLAEIFGKVVCRAAVPAREKERRAMEERRRAVIELFVHYEVDA